jgi:hypothetical protein
MQLREREKIFDTVFLIVFSALILVLFFALLSMNGLVLGNDPAVHIERTNLFLKTGKIPLVEIAFYPPLYHILLATFMAFTGVNGIEQTIFLIKSLTAVINWLIILAVYVFGTKFFGKKTGFLAAVLMLFLFPLYEINFWGGYPTLLSLSLMVLLFLYLSIEKKAFAHNLLIFLFAFSLVLSHQLTAFISFLIIAPFVIYAAVRFRSRSSKAWIAAIFGGLLAFFLYYSQTIIPHINDILVLHIFADLRSMLYQVPSVTFQSFVINFGFTLFFAFIGVFLAFRYRTKKKSNFYLLLLLSFLIPLLLSQSYLFGLYLPYQRFIYYLLPSLAIFAAVCLSYIVNLVVSFYHSHPLRRRRLNLKIAAVCVIILLSAMFVFRFGVVREKILESSTYYSTSDIKAYDAGMWLKTNYPEAGTVVVTETPGSWFALYTDKPTIAAIDTASGRNDTAETVLDLAYEIENPISLVRAYDAKGAISEENYVSLNYLWKRVSYSSADGNFISYRANGVYREEVPLSNFTREVTFEDQGSPKKLTIRYFNNEIAIAQTILVQNDSYPVNVTWSLSPVESQVSDVSLYVSNFFDLFFKFQEAYVPGLLDWQNPWSNPSYSQGNDWAVVNFSRSTLSAESYLGFYDENEEVVFAVNFQDLPDWGNVGVLGNMQIDAVRFQYNFDKINADQPASFTYQILTFSKSSYPEMQQPKELKSLFESKPSAPFDVKTRDYRDLINERNIKFIVYDKNELDTNIIGCKLLEMVYSNDRYVIFKVKNST